MFPKAPMNVSPHFVHLNMRRYSFCPESAGVEADALIAAFFLQSRDDAGDIGHKLRKCWSLFRVLLPAA